VEKGNLPQKAMDPTEALDRARQVLVLAHPERLSVLTLLTSLPDYSASAAGIAATLGMAPEVVDEALEALAQARLVHWQRGARAGDPRVSPTADAWIRFSSLLDKRPAPVLSDVPGAEIQIGPEGRPLGPHPVPGPTPPPGQEVPPVIHRIADQLAHRFSATFSAETVHRYVRETYFLLRSRSRVQRYLASLTSRFATERLHALALARGIEMRPVPQVLFVCVANSHRSQIAASILKFIGGDQVHVRSAGSAPATDIAPEVVEVLDEIGCSLLGEFPKPLTDEIVQASDVVITMGCGDACPVYPGRIYLDWAIEVPPAHDLQAQRVMRDEIQHRVEDLWRSLSPSGSEHHQP
jgi:protein-tyrosine-phosphatase